MSKITAPVSMNVKPAPPVKPLINIGCLMDVPTGNFELGLNGEAILNGGLGSFTGIVGAGDLGKSTIAHYRNIVACYRISPVSAITIYDTELNMNQYRLLKFIDTLTEEDGQSWAESGKWLITDPSMYSGDEWFDDFKEFMENKRKNKDFIVTTPFKDHKGEDGKYKAMKMAIPTFALIDSLSNFQTKDTTKMRDTNSLGDSGANMIAMTQNRQRDRVINETHHLSASSSTYTTMIGHIGEKIQMDPYAPNFRALATLKQNIKIKGVPPNFTFFTMSCWMLVGSSSLQNSDKTVLYPKDSNDKTPDDKDLNLVTLLQLRSKTGPSNITIGVILSKKEGILSTLSEFHFLKTSGRFGLPGNDQRYACALLPEESLQRTTVRGKIDSNPKLRRAINICSELLQMRVFWSGTLSPDLLCTPEELYEDIKNLGYDWDMILSHTRGWWTIEGEHQDSLFLSSMDLLRMRKGLYHPYWLEDDKKTIKKNYLKHLKVD